MAHTHGSNQTVRIVEDWTGRWVLWKWAANASINVTGTWSSVGLSTSTYKVTVQRLVLTLGTYPTECKFRCTDFTNYYNTRTIDFYPGIPSGRVLGNYFE